MVKLRQWDRRAHHTVALKLSRRQLNYHTGKLVIVLDHLDVWKVEIFDAIDFRAWEKYEKINQ